MYYFLKEDLDELNRRLTDLRTKADLVKREKGEFTKQSAETWHDNAPFEEAERQYKLLSSQLGELLRLKEQAQEVEPPFSKNKVAIGLKVTFKDMASGALTTFMVGSYMVLVNEESNISYASPLAQLILGARVGEIREGIVGSSWKTLKVTKIE
ncbi:hypothetical protein A3H53_01295 [Candidatus Nomurabacteria bacterium RIFCSPLOWO2_02_FULL_40_10]|uniref:Transcription elongation factor GreA/GreB C-terminal domain-containing protein n=1 Tax=Candidatus Nomurabacteria bacterium RIFCSPLOWO2_02_FULL_40_10 TaxID=1801786 RepID=A0A1F6XX31_9BACT|nr:MAG: hypothetical protein A3H53_01295 [Candidatus Nomurabacteria bacterium RIFCSPLOWO2_02_FULL_40_10]